MPYMSSASFMYSSSFTTRLPFHAVLQITANLAPPIFIDDIGQRDTANPPEPGHGIADRQQGIRMDAGWQAECGLRFLFSRTASTASLMSRRGEWSRREQHLLNRWVNGRAGC